MALTTSAAATAATVAPQPVEKREFLDLTTSAATTAAPQPVEKSHFLDLTAELRNTIYELAFTSNKSTDKTGVNLLTATPPSKNLLSCSKQIYNEARGIYKCGYRRFWTETEGFYIKCNDPTAISKIKSLKKEECAALTNLKLFRGRGGMTVELKRFLWQSTDHGYARVLSTYATGQELYNLKRGVGPLGKRWHNWLNSYKRSKCVKKLGIMFGRVSDEEVKLFAEALGRVNGTTRDEMVGMVGVLSEWTKYQKVIGY